MRTFYAVFDTNVLVSALMSKRADSPTVLLLDYVLDGRIVLLYNEDIIHTVTLDRITVRTTFCTAITCSKHYGCKSHDC